MPGSSVVLSGNSIPSASKASMAVGSGMANTEMEMSRKGSKSSKGAQFLSNSAAVTAASDARSKVTTTMWEDENTLCYQVEANGVSVVRRADNDMINGTKLLNVTRMTRGRRDGILKAERIRHVVKIGSMQLKGVWIPFERALVMAQREKIVDLLYPLFVRDIQSVIQQDSNGGYQPQTKSVPPPLPTTTQPSRQQQQQEQQQTLSGKDVYGYQFDPYDQIKKSNTQMHDQMQTSHSHPSLQSMVHAAPLPSAKRQDDNSNQVLVLTQGSSVMQQPTDYYPVHQQAAQEQKSISDRDSQLSELQQQQQQQQQSHHQPHLALRTSTQQHSDGHMPIAKPHSNQRTDVLPGSTLLQQV